jgi:class 3 adenylate cyclase
MSVTQTPYPGAPAYAPEMALIAVSDIINFTRLAKTCEPRILGDLMGFMAEHHVSHLEKSSGEIIKFMGDACLMVFPAEDADTGINLLADMRDDFCTKVRNAFGVAYLGQNVFIHKGEIYRITMPHDGRPDIFGLDVNTAFLLGQGVRSPAGGEVILSPQAFRSLSPASRKRFHKYTPPVCYRGE